MAFALRDVPHPEEKGYIISISIESHNRMDENRLQAYLELIKVLLNCPNGEEQLQILQANLELVDNGLVYVMRRVAEKMVAEGNKNAAWLRDYSVEIAYRIGIMTATPDEYFQFLIQLLESMTESRKNPNIAYSIIERNLNKFDENLTLVFQNLVTRTLSDIEYQKAQFVAADLLTFGNFIVQFPKGNKANNIETAIISYQSTLEVYTCKAFPEKWAMVQNNLGNAYSERILKNKADNLEQAIAAYTKALQVYTQEAFLQNWAATQHNLANAYSYRIWGDKAENLEKAIEFYKNALQVYTQETFPKDWAMTLSNLGNAYENRIVGKKADNLEEALSAYKQALQVYTHEAFPQDWAGTQNNLGVAYSNRIRKDKVENLEKAIIAYKKVLQVYTQEEFPQNWAGTQNNLGVAYQQRSEGKTENLEWAIECYKKALQVYTRKDFPQDWAMTQTNLGTAYQQRICGKKAQNLEWAIDFYHNALQVRTREAVPQGYIETLFNLGLAYRDSQKLPLAYDTFLAAIDTVESMREEIISGDESKQKLAEEWNKLYINLVETCLQLNQPIEALEYAERSKTRNLVEQILLRDSHAIFPPEVASELAQLRDDIASNQYQIQQGNVENYEELAQRLQHLRQQRNQLQDNYLPVGSGFRFASFQQTLDGDTAVIEWYITRKTFLAFIITKDAAPVVWQSTLDNLKKLIDWVYTYLQNYYTQRDTWRNQLADELQTLAQILHLDELLQLLPETCNRLILIPHQCLHLFPLHALPVNSDMATRFVATYPDDPSPTPPLQGKEVLTPPSLVGKGAGGLGSSQPEPHYLLDIFPNGVSYAPSCQLLSQAQQRKRPEFTNLFAIQNPTEDLFYTNLEVEAIRSFFSSAEVLAQQAATKTAMTASSGFSSAHCCHFSCHGEFKLDSPLESALVFANKERLTLGEIFGFKLDECRLVTLSACETGLTDFTNTSDEYIGLPNGFLYAGSPSVVSSLWTVNDLSTSLLMIKFYENLHESLRSHGNLQPGDVAMALSRSQSWLRNLTIAQFDAFLDRYNPQIEKVLAQLRPGQRSRFREYLTQTRQRQPLPFANPYYWAGFTPLGI